MNGEQLQRDLLHLAGVLPHRAPNTRNEQKAAVYLRERFREHTPDVAVEEFSSIETVFYLYASCFAEFALVSLLAHWFPWMAFTYGVGVFMAYLAEATGYRVLARLFPQYESQNVMARRLVLRPKRLVIVTAHYDSPRATPLAGAYDREWVHWAHLALVCCMFVVLAGCAVEGAGLLEGDLRIAGIAVRWAATGVLLAAAGGMVYLEVASGQSTGANDNASGAAVLLELSRRLAETPPRHTDVWLVATGSKYAGLNGMRHLLSAGGIVKKSSLFLNIDRVGRGRPRYVTAEGSLALFHSDRELVTLAASVGEARGITGTRLRGWSTDAIVPLARGYRAMTLTAATDTNQPDNPDDDPYRVSIETMQQTTDIAEALLRALDTDQGPPAETA
jgi:hypothetical protein